MIMKRFAIFMVCVLLTMAVFAEESDTCNIYSSGEMFFLASTLPEAKLGYTHSFRMPVLQGDGPLTSGNNLRLALTAEATPISVNGIFKAVLTPLAVLELTAGGRVGAGWELDALGVTGTGLNVADINGNEELVADPFDAILWKGFAGGTFQFSFAAVFPGDWTHVVIQSYHELNYHGNTKAEAGQSWYYEADDGENMNGLNYLGNFTLGYQTPAIRYLNMIALQAEWEKFLYDNDTADTKRTVWGDDLMRYTFSGIFMFGFTEKFGAAIITQFRTRRNFTNFDEHAANEGGVMYYQNRILDTADPLRIEFYRVAAALTYRF